VGNFRHLGSKNACIATRHLWGGQIMRLAIFPVAVLLLGIGVQSIESNDSKILRVGILASMGENKPPRYRDIAPWNLNQLVKEFTGFRSVTLQGLDAFTSAKQLEAKKWDLGVFQGIEFAWVQKRYPNLKPLMLAIMQDSALQAALVVRKGSGSKKFADLKGKDIAILESSLPCRVFADENVTGQSRNTFAKFYESPNGNEALSDVLNGKVKAAIVDTPSLLEFQDLYPGRYKNLTILAKSRPFPPPVIVYREGALPGDLLKQFRNGMLKVSKSEKGKVALSNFGILRFQNVPADFHQTLSKLAAKYPSPN
jgi:ABC-type phosphate/phosphonate transport system substrate-binding protein